MVPGFGVSGECPISILLLVWRSIMFNGSFLRVCRILRFVKKFDFAFMSLGGPSHGAGFGVLAECQSIGTIGKK